MIFPIGDDNVKGGHKPIVAYVLIGINVLVFIFQAQMSNVEMNVFFHDYGVVPKELLSGEDRYTLLSNMFLHGSWMHLLGNMVFLWVFGDNVEAIIGNLPFLAFYLVGGVIASLIHVSMDMTSLVPAVGASGAIAAVMGAYLVMFPKSRIRMIVLVFFRTFHIPAIFFLGFWIVQQLISGFTTMDQTGQAGVAWWAHIGGFVFGAIIGYCLKKFHPYKYSAKGYTAPSPDMA